MKKTVSLLLCLVLLVLTLAGCGGSKDYTGKHTVQMVIKDYGTITIEVDCDNAPLTGSQFLNLVKSGFYKNLTVYRAIKGFALYAGSPNKDGTGNSGETISGEFTSNGYNNTLSHTRGAVGMARGVNKNSGSCQFYIMQNHETWLDGDFAVFGRVTEGMDIVDQIISAVGSTGDGYIPSGSQPVISSAKITK